MKKFLLVLLSVLMAFSMVACSKDEGKDNEEKSAVQQIIEEAQGMTLEELAKKAIAKHSMALETPAVVNQLYLCSLLTYRQLIQAIL